MIAAISETALLDLKAPPVPEKDRHVITRRRPVAQVCAIFRSASPVMSSVVHRRNGRRKMSRRRHTPLEPPLQDPATGTRPPVPSSRRPCLHEGQRYRFPPRLLLAAQSHSSLRPLRLHRTPVRRLPPSYMPVRNGRPSKSPQPPQLLRLPRPCCGSGARRRSTTMSSSPRAKLSRVRFSPPPPSDEADMLFRRQQPISSTRAWTWRSSGYRSRCASSARRCGARDRRRRRL